MALGKPPASGLVLADWTAVALRPAAPAAFRHVVVVDPPPTEALEGLTLLGRGYLHLAWGPAELELTERLLAREWELRAAIGEIWRSLAEAGREAEGEGLRALLTGHSRYPRTPEVAARCLGVLEELGLCDWRPDGAGGALRVLSSERTDLARSRAYAACRARHEEAIRFLRNRAQT
jgi:hypothetical protein